MPLRSRRRPMRSLMVCSKACNSAAVGADTRRKYGGSMSQIHPIRHDHVEMNIEVERTAKALNQGDGAALSVFLGKSGFLDLKGGDGAINDAERFAQRGRVARKQET